jgi:hypothetical protein
MTTRMIYRTYNNVYKCEYARKHRMIQNHISKYNERLCLVMPGRTKKKQSPPPL